MVTPNTLFITGQDKVFFYVKEGWCNEGLGFPAIWLEAANGNNVGAILVVHKEQFQMHWRRL